MTEQTDNTRAYLSVCDRTEYEVATSEPDRRCRVCGAPAGSHDF